MSAEIVIPGGGTLPTPPPPAPPSGTEGLTLAQLIRRVRQYLRPRRNPSQRYVSTGTAAVGGLTLMDLRTRVRTVLRDDSGSFVTDADIHRWLNDACLDLAWRERAIQKSVTDDTATGVITLPAGTLEVLDVEVAGQPVDLIEDAEEWRDWRFSGEDPPRTLGYIFEGKITLYPTPVGTPSYTVRYTAAPATLATDGAIPELPRPLVLRAVHYAMAQGLLKVGLVQEAGGYMQAYENGLAPGKELEEVGGKDVAQLPREITDDDITDWLNDAGVDLAWRTKCLQLEVAGEVADGTVPLPAGFQEPRFLRLGTDDVQWTDDDQFHDWLDSGASAPRTMGRVFGAIIELYPAPATGTDYLLRYYARPADLTAADQIPDIPAVLQRKMVDFAIAQGKLVEQDQAAHDRYMGRYEMGLPIASATSRNMPAPWQLIPEGNVFDIDASARHR